MDDKKWLARGGFAVAAVVFLMFLFAAWKVVVTVDDPPLVSDPAPTVAPALLCPSATPNTGTGTGTTSTGGATGSTGSETGSNGTGTSTGTAATSSTATSTGPVDSTGSTSLGTGTPTTDLGCDPTRAVLAPQYRGAYDPHARLMALIAVLGPLLTTIVAFYFGRQAGAGQGEAEKQKVVSQVLATDASQPDQVTELQERLKRMNKLWPR